MLLLLLTGSACTHALPALLAPAVADLLAAASALLAGETRSGRYAMSLATMVPAQMETPTLPTPPSPSSPTD